MSCKLFWLYLVIAITLTASCEKEKNQVIPDEVRPFVEQFFEAANARGKLLQLEDYDLTITFEKLSDNTAGNCNPLRRRSIQLDPDYWKAISTCDRKFLIYHELGHCLLDRGHLNDSNIAGVCKSMMYDPGQAMCTLDFTSSIWQDYYVNELFYAEQNIDTLWDRSFNPRRRGSEPALYQIDEKSIDDSTSFFETVVIPFDEGRATVICNNLTFLDDGNRNYSVILNGVNFQFCDCESAPLSVYRTSTHECRSIFNSNQSLDDIKIIQIELSDSFTVLYVNDEYVHLLDPIRPTESGNIELKVRSSASVSSIRVEL